MEITLSPEQETQLSELAAKLGKPAQQVAKECVSDMLEERAQFAAAVQRGFDSFDRGEYLEHEEVVARIERLLA